eukprot:gb/GECH01001285.1/.p1 GENE.gb/GECH01001285.1/~~gb/GECH01001285.1/.p1  ORF type:complete len:361 (+),score=88.73 gb/GECH01001285.1/:1-1083(+)
MSSTAVPMDISKANLSKNTLPWVEKYRPETLDNLMAHDDIVSTLKRMMNNDRLPHLLLYGPAGTGKTSTILAVAKTMFGSQNYRNYVLELNASDQRGIDVVRQQIKDFASTQKIFFQPKEGSNSDTVKLIILDEADHMTSEAQAALRRIIEKYTRNARFCLICNYVNKIIPAIQSRCTRFRFAPLKKAQITSRLEEITNQEQIDATSDALNAVARLSQGDMRKCLNILQSVALSASGKIDANTVYDCTGSPNPRDVHSVVKNMLNLPMQDAYNKVSELKVSKGLALNDLLYLILEYVHKLDTNADTKIYLLEHLANIENNLAFGGDEKLQLSSLIGGFQIAKEAITQGTTTQNVIGKLAL